MKLMTINEANYVENKYLHLTNLQNKLGKVKAVVKTSNELDENYFKVVVVVFTDNAINDKFFDLDKFCEIVGIEYNEE